MTNSSTLSTGLDPEGHFGLSVLITPGLRTTTVNDGFSAMLASEYMLIDISIFGSARSDGPSGPNITELWNLPAGRQVYPQLSIFAQQYRAAVT